MYVYFQSYFQTFISPTSTSPTCRADAEVYFCSSRTISHPHTYVRDISWQQMLSLTLSLDNRCALYLGKKLLTYGFLPRKQQINAVDAGCCVTENPVFVENRKEDASLRKLYSKGFCERSQEAFFETL